MMSFDGLNSTSSDNTNTSSLARAEMDGDLDVSRGDLNPNVPERSEDNQLENDTLEGLMSGDDDDEDEQRPKKKKKVSKYRRHTPYQIQELESFFNECRHPSEKQRLELGSKLSLESKQIKFWFQNKRTQMKTQLERHENMTLRQENEKLRGEYGVLEEAMISPVCNNCGGPATPSEVAHEHQQLLNENAQLKYELDRLFASANRFGSISLEKPSNGENGSQDLSVGHGFIRGTLMPQSSMLMDLAMMAMNELMKLAELDNPIWIKGSKRDRYSMNHDAYRSIFAGRKHPRFAVEGSRETGVVLINSLSLVDTLMDTNRWTDMFECIVAVATTIEVISNGSGGSRNGSLQSMQAEFQVMSPLVPIRQVKFLRYCKQHGDGLWAVVDVSYDMNRDNENSKSYGGFKRLPSGCIIQDIGNGCSKVMWIEHSEFEGSQIHPLYKPVLGSSVGFGATRWLATLQRRCESYRIPLASQDQTGLPLAGTKSMLTLARRMKLDFYSGITASFIHNWEKLVAANLGQNTRILTRKSLQPSGVILSTATSMWLPVTQQRLFEFLCDCRCRNQWDILCHGASMENMLLIPKGHSEGTCVSLLHPAGKHPNENSVLILQETWNDASGALVVYAPVDFPSMHTVMSGGDSANVALLPSGFSILPDGSSPQIGTSGGLVNHGCLLTVGFQILVSTPPTAKLNMESIQTVNNLMACTIRKIKAALRLPA